MCRDLKRTLLFVRRKETFRDNNFTATVHVNDACEMTIFGSKITRCVCGVFCLDFRYVVEAKIVRSDCGCEDFECRETVKRCEYSENVKLKIVASVDTD